MASDTVTVTASSYREARQMVGPDGLLSGVSRVRVDDSGGPTWQKLHRWAFEAPGEARWLEGVRRYTFR